MLLAAGIIGLYFTGLAIVSYIKGRFFYRLDDDLALFLMVLWPIALVLALPVTIILTAIKYIGYGMGLIMDMGEKKYFAKQAEARRIHDAEQALRNIEMFEDNPDNSGLEAMGMGEEYEGLS